ncbi:MAG: site-specific integrase [Rubrivivax sp.]|nr:site-specific integrase [Rubrivivax sp.]
MQVRRGGAYRAATFDKKSDARAWATAAEAQAKLAHVSGYAPPPAGATVADLIDKYREQHTKEHGKTKRATLAMLHADRLGRVKLASLSALDLRDFVDRRVKDGAGGTTIAADLSFLSSVLKWGRHVRRLDLPVHLAMDARRDLAYRGLSTRSAERDREPTDAELSRLYAHWQASPRQRIDMVTLCRFALATAMRQDEICRLQAEDVNVIAKTVLIRDRKDPQRKAGNNQEVPLLPDAWAIVKPILRERSTGRLFPYSSASVSTAFTRACATLGIEDLHFHDLRHRATADLFRQGLDIPRVALMTGHKTWAQLKRYTKIKPEDVHAALADRAAVRAAL